MVGVLLDTCVLSEVHKSDPNPAVISAITRLDRTLTFLSAITIGELTHGFALLPRGRRRSEVEAWVRATDAAFADRVLPIDADVARTWGLLAAHVRNLGFQVAAPDTLIAATAITHQLTIVTRNAKHFEPTGVDIINPWDS